MIWGFGSTAVVMALIPLVIPDARDSAPALWGMAALWLFLAGVIYLQNYANYTRYETLPEGLFLRGVYKKAILPWEEIDSCEWLSPEASQAYIHEKFSEIARSEAELDLYTWWQANKKYAQATRYATVQAVHQVTTRGNERNISDIQSRVEGSFLVLKMKNGQEYILTANDPEALASEINRR